MTIAQTKPFETMESPTSMPIKPNFNSYDTKMKSKEFSQRDSRPTVNSQYEDDKAKYRKYKKGQLKHQ